MSDISRKESVLAANRNRIGVNPRKPPGVIPLTFTA
jgi:hypothetical protein